MVNEAGNRPRRSAFLLLPGFVQRLLRSERIRYLVVGAFNTFLGYGLFVLLELLTGQWLGYFFSLYGSYVLATFVAFTLHRRFTFQVSGTGNVVIDFVRFQGVYVIALLINTIALPLLVEVAGWHPVLAQLLIVVVTTLISYFGHKLFSFRRPIDEAENEDGLPSGNAL